MKKLLALGLSLAMMASLSAVAFAETVQDGDSNHDEDPTTVLVYTDATEDPSASQNWVVTIPADINVDWGDTSEQKAPVKVTGQLLAGSTIDVTAPALTTLDNNGETLAVKMDAFEMNVIGDNTVLNKSEDITFTVSGFESVTLGKYQNTITFTVDPQLVTE
ncbi:MAG: hypothetical protein ACLU8W_07190 [Clostridia bacterium]